MVIFLRFQTYLPLEEVRIAFIGNSGGGFFWNLEFIIYN